MSSLHVSPQEAKGNPIISSPSSLPQACASNQFDMLAAK
jgi:hypothetical protein